MGKNDRDVVARRELAHALEALADGAGHEVWGPGPVITRLSKRALKEPAVSLAVEALEAAVMASHDLLGAIKRDEGLSAIRALAPVFLELIITKDARAPKPAPNPWRKLFPKQPVTRERADSQTSFERLVREARAAKLTVVPPHHNETLATFAKVAFPTLTGLRPCPVIAPPMHCIGCGLKDTAEPSVHVRVDGFARCNDCEREAGGL